MLGRDGICISTSWNIIDFGYVHDLHKTTIYFIHLLVLVLQAYSIR